MFHKKICFSKATLGVMLLGCCLWDGSIGHAENVSPEPTTQGRAPAVLKFDVRAELHQSSQVTVIPKAKDERIIIAKDGLQLRASFLLPKSKSSFGKIANGVKLPAVLLLVGSGVTNRFENVSAQWTADGKATAFLKSVSDEFLKKGIAVLAYDKRGVQSVDSSFTTAELNASRFETATADQLFMDALSAFDFLKLQPEIDATRISLLGHSEGAVLALKIAETRKEVHSINILGGFVRSFEEIAKFQMVDMQFKIYQTMDQNHDGLISNTEWIPFHKDNPSLFPAWNQWSAAKEFLIKGSDGAMGIPLAKLQLFYAGSFKDFVAELKQGPTPLSKATFTGPSEGAPKAWYRQYLKEGSYLNRYLAFCEKISIFHGEKDTQTPYEDAVALEKTCAAKGTPIMSFNGYPQLGHGFSAPSGLKDWRDTFGPMHPKVTEEIGTQLSKNLAQPR